MSLLFFFFNDTATTEIYPLSLHDALPISTFAILGGTMRKIGRRAFRLDPTRTELPPDRGTSGDRQQRKDRKSTRLNSSHQIISYAVFCLKKKKQHPHKHRPPQRELPRPLH